MRRQEAGGEENIVALAEMRGFVYNIQLVKRLQNLAKNGMMGAVFYKKLTE